MADSAGKKKLAGRLMWPAPRGFRVSDKSELSIAAWGYNWRMRPWYIWQIGRGLRPCSLWPGATLVCSVWRAARKSASFHKRGLSISDISEPAKWNSHDKKAGPALRSQSGGGACFSLPMRRLTRANPQA